MRTLRTIAEVRAALGGARQEGKRIGLVPTMGAFHEGHLALMRRAREDCDCVVVSLFVNPAQFGPNEDLAAYPRDEARDAALAADCGADLLFAPPVEEIYPPGFSTTVTVRGVSEPLEGAHRGSEHFDGVATVVAKLFNIVAPDVAYFGQKDAQQVTVIRRMVRDLDLPVRIEALATVREDDGLALSSRNVYLGREDRLRAVALRRGLDAAEAAIRAGERDASAIAERGREVMRLFDVEPEYFELVNPETLATVTEVDGEVLATVAARVGPARLIDNTLISPNGRR